LIHESDAIHEWKLKCEELGLDGQLSLMKEGKSPIPFECMNEVQKRVYETICPAKEDYKRYNKTAIPLEVLSLIALSEKENYFDGIQIWYDDKSPDPIAVGMKKQEEWSFKFYPIARWADALRPFDELKKMALARYTSTQTLNLKKKIAEAQQKLQDVELNSEMYFDGLNNSYDVVGF
jgi:hypothetical protein